MSHEKKNLENEYREIMARELESIDADALWSRIEAALPEKMPVSDENGINNESDNISDMTIHKETDNKGNLNNKGNARNKRYRNSIIISFLGTAAAACLILVVARAGFIMRNLTDSKSESAYMQSAAVDDSHFNMAESECAEATTDDVCQPDGEDSVSMTETPAEQVIQADFTVLEVTDDMYRCVLNVNNELMDEGAEFYIFRADDELTVSERYIFELETVGEYSGELIFNIKK